MQKNMKKKLFFKILFLFFIFIIAIFIWYSPVLFKGYSNVIPVSSRSIARNIVTSGKFSLESEKNVILGSGIVKEKGVISSQGNKMSVILSALVYKIFGVPDNNQAVFIGIVIYALALFFFFLTIWRLFGYLQAILFASVYIFLPVIWETAIHPNFYEFSLLFLSLSFFVLTIEFKRYKWIKYSLSGVFLALCCMCRDAMSLLIPALFIWFWIYKKRAIVPLFFSMVVVMVLFSVIFQFNFGKTSNYHFSYFSIGGEKAKQSDFSFYGHLYPDPYTYHYEREQYLNKQKEIIKAGGLEAQNISKRIANIEAGEMSLGSHFTIAPILFLKHIASMISLENVGGPLIFLFFLLGIWYLYKINKSLAAFVVIWIGFVFFLLSIVVLAQRNHVMDFGFVYAGLVGLGILKSGQFLSEKITINGKVIKAEIWSIIVLVFVMYHLILSSHIVFSRIYDNKNFLKLNAYKEIVLDSGVADQDVIATPLNSSEVYGINYLTDKSFIVFNNKTIRKLIDEDKLDFAFKEFGVTRILGYSPEFTKEILKNTEVQNISDNSITIQSIDVSPIKSLFMNLVK